jgi:hypothetical protein
MKSVEAFICKGKNYVFRDPQIANPQIAKIYGLQIANPQIVTFAEGPKIANPQIAKIYGLQIANCHICGRSANLKEMQPANLRIRDVQKLFSDRPPSIARYVIMYLPWAFQ